MRALGAQSLPRGRVQTPAPLTPPLLSLPGITMQAIAETTKRLEIVAHLVAALRAILDTNPSDLLPAVYLCVNRVAPAHTGIELGIGEATLIKVGQAVAPGRRASLTRGGCDYEVIPPLW